MHAGCCMLHLVTPGITAESTSPACRVASRRAPEPSAGADMTRSTDVPGATLRRGKTGYFSSSVAIRARFS